MKKLILGWLLLSGYSTVGWSQEVTVTPYRPTVTNTASLPTPGWIELEMGAVLRQEREDTRQTSLPYLAKFALSPDFGVLLGGDAFIAQTGNTTTTGFGDATVLLKHRYALDDATATALGWEYGFKAPTAAVGLGSGSRDIILNGIYSTAFAGHWLDVNLNVTQLGGMASNENPNQYGFSATIFRPLDDKLGVMAELSGTARDGAMPQNQWLVAANYMINPKWVVDAGLSAGINSASQRFTVFAGMSMLLGQVR